MLRLVINRPNGESVTIDHRFTERNRGIIENLRDMAITELHKWTGGDLKIYLIDTGDE